MQKYAGNLKNAKYAENQKKRKKNVKKRRR